MTSQIINCNVKDLLCVTIKLISGEELIAHVCPEQYNNFDDPSIVLHDPYLIKVDVDMVNMIIWILSNKDREYVLDKSDIMIRCIPDEHFQTMYNDMVINKYESVMESDMGDDMGDDNIVVFEGNETIN